MKKKVILMLVVLSFIVVGCSKNTYGLDFKKEYESLNGETNKSGKAHRVLDIDEDNPYIKVDTSDILKRIDNKETFYVYFGDKLCPWCRSVIEKSIEVAKEANIDKIYYVAIWDSEGAEVVRDKYEFVDGNLTKTVEGNKDYQKLLEVFDELLKEYTIKDSDGETHSTGEKRIYAPNYIYIEKGVPKKLITGISEKQTDSRGELTEEILKDEEQQFKDFFDNK
ncbi:MAG: hypothetical protein IJ068_02650 [Bacilli bacterium]|nr:hypothetical protein [Bacilli bacterium]